MNFAETRRRLDETHGTRFELLRHFLPRFFDSDLISSSGDWTRVAGGGAAILASSWMMLGYVLIVKYRKLAEWNLTARIPEEIHSDLGSLTGMAVCLTLLLAAVLWQSLYPSLRDYIALAGFPVSSPDLFVAKFAAVLVVFAAFLVLLAVPTSLVFSALPGARMTTCFVTIAPACGLAFFGLIALQGLLLNLLPGRWFERAMIWMQALLAAIGLGGLPLAAWQGKRIIGGLRLTPEHLSLLALAALLTAVLTYVMSFHRYLRLLLETPRMEPPLRRDLLSWIFAVFAARQDPRQQGAFAFIWTTILRNRTHRLAILVYAGLALAWLAKTALEVAVQEGARSGDLNRLQVTMGPVALIAFTLIGLRHLFALPADLRANWVFQITEREGRLAWMKAVEGFVMGCGVVPVVLIGSFFLARRDGPAVAAAWASVAFAGAAIGFERLFRDWRKMPFTCSYLPGKRPLLMNLTMFAVAMFLLTPVAYLAYRAASNAASFAITLALEIGIWSFLRRSRMKTWGLLPLRYEDHAEAEIDTFGFSSDGTVLAQEEFQREWNRYLQEGVADPLLRPLEAGETRLRRVRGWLRTVPQDLRFAARLLVKKPGFAASVVLTLGLGIGLNAAFFTVFNGLLLRPLVVRDPASVVSIGFETAHREPVHLNWSEYQAMAAETPALPEIAATTMEGTGLDGHAAKFAMVSRNFFSLLGASISRGRAFQADETEPVMVLSYRTWQNRFGADERILGRRLMVQGIPFEVVGVASPEFVGVNAGTIAVAPPEVARFGVIAADFWVPVEVWNGISALPQYPVYGVIARLPKGIEEDQARQMLSGVSRRITANHEQYDRISNVVVESLDIPITWTALRFSLPLLVAFGLTMLIPCANAANMMLARAMTRQRELGTRLSLGASRGRIVRQLLAESLLFAVLASGLGLVVSRISLDLFTRSLYATAPSTLLFRLRIPDFVVDRHVYFYMILVASLTTALFGLAPAIQVTRVAVASAFRGEVGGMRPSRLRDALVIAQVSGCVMLLAIAGVLVRGAERGMQLERGYEFGGVFGVSNQGPEDAAALKALIDREAWVDTMAFLGSAPSGMGTMLVGTPARPARESIYFMGASGDYFPLVHLPLTKGRTFSQDEGARRAPVAVISELAARKLWPGEEAVGKALSIEPGDQSDYRRPAYREATVIGVCRDIVAKAKDNGPRPVIYFADGLRRGTMLAVRGRGTPIQTAKQLEAALARAPGAAHGARVVALQEVIDWETYPQRAASWLSSTLGLVAFLLTMTGIYGVMSYAVGQRTKEIGIRMALGATSASIARLVFAYAMRMTGVGLVFGTVLAIGVLQYAASRIELAVDRFDLPAYSGSLAAVTVAALLAGLAPVRRACEVDPQQAVRTD